MRLRKRGRRDLCCACEVIAATPLAPFAGAPQDIGSDGQRACVMAQMILNERADEVVAVIVAGLQTQGQCLAVVVAGAIKAFGLQLRF